MSSLVGPNQRAVAMMITAPTTKDHHVDREPLRYALRRFAQDATPPRGHSPTGPGKVLCNMVHASGKKWQLAGRPSLAGLCSVCAAERLAKHARRLRR